jgi:EAL domain-containing protein (putative c-di-GMP-specific phosphodiesterase class I)/ActR/RegA family two-component response regulator
MDEPAQPKILVLDDDTFMLKVLVRMLADQGHAAVLTCTTGREALAWVGHPDGPPNLILCDLNMPEMDGVEFVRKLVERSYEGSLILVSGEDERLLKTAEKLVKAHRLTVLGRLHKPVTPHGLSALLKTWRPPFKGEPRTTGKTYGADAVRGAIARGELVNHYQPKVAVGTGAVVGVETLVRWQHPADGMVYPDQFIGVAETHGLIQGLTRVVLTEALAQARLWQEAGLGLRVAVNVSMDDLNTVAFAAWVAGAAGGAEVPPQDVVLEVTESRLMGDARAPLEVLTRLRLKRFHLSIDDFGTGHSSFAQLRDIPFNELKIDQTFVHGAWADPTIRAIYDASLGLGNQLGMQVVAEGVEDQADWAFLQATHCHVAQGYFIGRPMPAAAIPAWMGSWRERWGVMTPAPARPSSPGRQASPTGP